MKKILVSVINDLSTDQRVAKVCQTLFEEGFEVVLIGRNQKDSIPINRPYKTVRIRMLFQKGPLMFAEFNLRLFLHLLFQKKDLLLSNDLDTLLANVLVKKMQHKPLLFDSHELFSEIPELVHRPKVKSFWHHLEKTLIPQTDKAYTVSNAIAQHYQKLLKVPFEVIRNVPMYNSVKTTAIDLPINNRKIILYQGAVNLGRGLELMIDSMKHLDHCVLIIIGTGDIIDDLKLRTQQSQLNDRVFFLGKLPPDKLKSFTPNADIGISLEEDLGLNYRYALPNKIFDYIQAEVPVLVANLPEMKKMVKDHGVGEILYKRTPEALAKSIALMIDQNNYEVTLKKAKQTLTWDRERETLISLFSGFQ